MATSEKLSNLIESRFAQTLLSTTCLGALGSISVSGQVINEGTSPAPSDFGGTFGTAYVLPMGTTTVRGGESSSDADFFEFTNLSPGTSFSLLGSYNPAHQEAAAGFFHVYNSSQTQIGSATLEGVSRPGGTVTGTVPNDGTLTVQVGGSGGSSSTYQFDMTATVVPEPAQTALAVGGATLAGAFAWRRKRAKKQ